MRKREWKNLINISELEKGDVTNVKFGSRDLAVFDAEDGIFVNQTIDKYVSDI